MLTKQNGKVDIDDESPAFGILSEPHPPFTLRCSIHPFNGYWTTPPLSLPFDALEGKQSGACSKRCLDPKLNLITSSDFIDQTAYEFNRESEFVTD